MKTQTPGRSPATDATVNLAVFSGVPAEARALIWDVFFSSRQRGVDLPTHFPWIEHSAGTHCLTLKLMGGGPLVATLVLRQLELTPSRRAAMVGMVCVNPTWRGRGISKQLLTNALAFATEQRLAALILWTGQPSIYSPHGFVLDGCDSFGTVMLNPQSLRKPTEFSRSYSAAARGLPPFAQRLLVIENATAQLHVLETAQGIALAEWRGHLSSVLDLIEAALPTSWGINAAADDPLFGELHRRGHSYTPLPCANRMALFLDTPAPLPYISVLDRI